MDNSNTTALSFDAIAASGSFKSPSRYKGLPSISFSDNEIAELSSRFNLAIVGKFRSGRPFISTIRKVFEKIGFESNFSISLLDDFHILIRFSSHNDFLRCLLRKFWKIDGYNMKVFHWTADFDPTSDSPLTPVCIGLEGLPLHLFDATAIFSIANLIGKPLKADTATLQLSRPSVARICVELDLSKDLPPSVWIHLGKLSYLQPIVYEDLPEFCSSCRKFGHKNCQSKPKSRWIQREVRTNPPASSTGTKMNNANISPAPANKLNLIPTSDATKGPDVARPDMLNPANKDPEAAVLLHATTVPNVLCDTTTPNHTETSLSVPKTAITDDCYVAALDTTALKDIVTSTHTQNSEIEKEPDGAMIIQHDEPLKVCDDTLAPLAAPDDVIVELVSVCADDLSNTLLPDHEEVSVLGPPPGNEVVNTTVTTHELQAIVDGSPCVETSTHSLRTDILNCQSISGGAIQGAEEELHPDIKGNYRRELEGLQNSYPDKYGHLTLNQINALLEEEGRQFRAAMTQIQTQTNLPHPTVIEDSNKPPPLDREADVIEDDDENEDIPQTLNYNYEEYQYEGDFTMVKRRHRKQLIAPETTVQTRSAFRTRGRGKRGRGY